MGRVSKDKYFLQMALLTATRGTCPRRQVGCVLVNALGHVIGTGYNGVPRGVPHCHEIKDTNQLPIGVNLNGDITFQMPSNFCTGATYSSGEGLDKCQAVHAEQNALLQCADTQQIAKAYISCSPCMHCIKLFMNTSCQELVFGEEYASAEDAKALWLSVGRKWTLLTN